MTLRRWLSCWLVPAGVWVIACAGSSMTSVSDGGNDPDAIAPDAMPPDSGMTSVPDGGNDPDAIAPDASIELGCSGTGKALLGFVRVARLDARRFAVGSEVVVENGHAFLHIRDDCRYYVFDVGETDAGQWPAYAELAETRAGRLTISEIRQLGRRLQVEKWKGLSGGHASLGGHAEPDVLYMGETEISATDCVSE